MMRTILLVVAVALLSSGCVGVNAQQTIEALAQSDRSWCLAVSTVYGTLRASGTGLNAGRVRCSMEGMDVSAKQLAE